MKQKSQIKFVLIGLVLMITSAGCNKSKDPKKIRSEIEQEIGFGQLNEKTYTNDYFNLKITFPQSWHISSKAERKELDKIGEQIMREPIGANKAAFDAAKARTMNLLGAFKFPPGTPTNSPNCFMMIMAERVAHLPGIKTGADYLQHSQKTLETQSKLKMTFQPILHGEAIGSLTADCLPMVQYVQGVKVNQRMYATRVRDYILVVSTTYITPQDQQTLEGLLKSMQASQ